MNERETSFPPRVEISILEKYKKSREKAKKLKLGATGEKLLSNLNNEFN